MIRIILTILLVIPMLCRADDRSSALITKLATQMRGYKSYQVQFTAKVDGGSTNVDGRYVVSGNRYYITVEDREIFSDGKQKFEVNNTDKEVTIDVVNPNDKDMLSNPTRAFDFIDGGYAHSYKGESMYGGRKVSVVVLSSATPSAVIKEIALMLDPVSGLPVGVRYTIDGVASAVEISVGKITQLTSVSNSQFNFDKNKYKGYEIIDFR